MMRRVAQLLWSLPLLAEGQALERPLQKLELHLLQTRLAGRSLGSPLEVYGEGGRYFLPFGELCRLLNLGLRVEGRSRRLEGFTTHERRRFLLNLDQGMAVVQERRLPFAPGQVHWDGDVLYVDAALLEAWLPLEVRVDPLGSLLNLKPLERLPIQDDWERAEKLGDGLRQYGSSEGGPKGVLARVPYAFLDFPILDLQVATARSSGGGNATTTGTVSMAGDLAWMSSSFYGTRDASGEWRNLRGTLFREDPRGGLLGPLKAQRVAIGDLMDARALDVVGALPQGRGITVDNYPLAYRTRFATRTFRGALPEGWSVELHQNGGLVGYQRSRPDGLFEFPEVPLSFGLNQLQLVFHGPQGQRREETFRMDIAQDMPQPGAFHYGFTALKPTRELSELNVLQQAMGKAEQTAYMASLEYGVAPWLALHGGGARMELPDGPHTYTSAGVRGVLRSLAFQVTGVEDRPSSGQPSGRATEVTVRTGLGYSSLGVRQAFFRGTFLRSAFGMGMAANHVNRIPIRTGGIDLSTSLLPRGGLNLTLSTDEERYRDGSVLSRDRAQFTTQVGKGNLGWSVSRMRHPGEALERLESGLLFSSHWSALSLSGDLQFERIDGKNRFQSWRTMADYRVEGGLQYRVELQRYAQGGSPVRFQAGVLKQQGRFGFGLDGTRSGKNWSLFGRFQVSLGVEPRSMRLVTDALAQGSQGALSAVAFQDTNGNGRKDGDETLLKDIRIKIGSSAAANRLKDGAVAYVNMLPRGQEIEVSLDEGSLEDPAQQATVKAYRIVPRPGKTARLDFPVSIFGEVNGTTRVRRAGKTRELPGLEIELVGAGGTPVKVIRSGYDGYFEFRDLPLGDYLLRVTAAEVARVKLKPLPPRLVHFDAQRNILDGQDLVVEYAIEEAGEEPPVTTPIPAAPPVTPAVAATIPVVSPAPTSTAPSVAAPMAPSALPVEDANQGLPKLWTVVLVYAFEQGTVEQARKILGAAGSEIFTQYEQGRVGRRPLMRVCLGRYATAADAERILRTLPAHFLQGGNRPRVAPILPDASGRRHPCP